MPTMMTHGASADPDLVALLDGWSAAGHGTLPRRLAHALRRSVQAGVLPTGWRLPPERHFATQLAVSRATVSEALDELRAEGLLTSKQGSGTYVAVPSAAPVGTRVAEHLTGGRGVDLATGNPPDLSHLPPVEVDMSALNAGGGGPGVFALGLPATRLAIADLYSMGRVSARPHLTDAEQINVTAGAHQAISLLVSTLVGRGGGLALAAVNYPGIFDILDGCEARPVPIRTDRAGMLPEALEQAIVTERPSALYVQAGPDNPTGVVVPPGRARVLTEVIDRHEIPVIEDNTLAPLAFRDEAGESRVTYLLDTCRTAPVASVGSMSKVCWAGLRLGWIRAPQPLIDRTMYRKLAGDLGPSAPSQLLALGLFPHLDTIAAERRRRLVDVVDLALDHLAASLPEAVVVRPGGGSVLWVEFPVADTDPLVHLARRHGVQVAPGSISVTGRVPGPFVRICVDRPPDLVREGLDRLARAWRDLRSSMPAVTG